MNFLEKDLEQIIYEADRKELENSGLPIYGTLFKQLRIGNYGIADLVSVDKEYNYFEDRKIKVNPYLSITVYELKKDKIGIAAFLQAVKYVNGISSFLLQRGFHNVLFSIALVGSKIDTSGSFCSLPGLILGDEQYPEHQLSCLNFYTYSYGINGLKFNSDYCFSKIENEGFDSMLKLKKNKL